MKKILLLSSDVNQNQMFSQIILRINGNVRIFVTNDIKEAYGFALDNDVSLFIVDVVLNLKSASDISGLYFVKNIRDISKYEFVPIVLVSSLKNYEMYAYSKLHCFSCIGKSSEYMEIVSVLSYALRYNYNAVDGGELVVRKNGALHVLKKEEIVFIKNHNGKMTLKTIRGEENLYYYSCRQILKQLKSTQFIRCNRNTIVNKEYISKIDCSRNLISLVDDYGIIQIGSVIKKDFLKEYRENILKV